MRVNFQKSVKDIINMVGSTDYVTLVELCEKHGIAANEVFDQLAAGVSSGEIGRYKPFGKPTLYQEASMGKKIKEFKKVELDDKQVGHIQRFIFSKFVDKKNKKFRPGSLADFLNEEGQRRYTDENDDEHLWTAPYVEAALEKLAEKKVILKSAKRTRAGVWYWKPDWTPKAKKEDN